jgi:hypothetical protein
MTDKEFINALANGKADVIQNLLDLLEKTDTLYCLIGGLAVNAYVDPVVSLDLDIVVALENVTAVIGLANEQGSKVETFEHSINISSASSDLRIQLQTDPQYQAFISRAGNRKVLGYTIRVAALDDVLQGKVWAYMDKTRRKSKRQKDLADIMRILEAFPELEEKLPQGVRDNLNKD